MRKSLLLLTAGVLGLLCGVAQKAVATSQGCITVQGITACGGDIPDNPTLSCTDDASCDGGANDDPTAPPEAPPGDDPPVDPGSDPPPGNTPTTTDETTTTDSSTTEATVPPPSYCEATPSADIGVKAASDAGQYTVGSMVRYSLDVFDNHGHGECSASGSMLTFQVARQLELLSPNGVSTDTGSCGVTGDVGSQLVTCSFGTLQPNQHASIMVEVRADSIGNAASVAGVSTTVSDSNVGENQQSTVTVRVVASPKQSAAHQRMSQSRETVRAQGLIWDGRTFRSTDEFVGWLSARGGSWDRFEQDHPAAAGGLIDRG